MNRIIILLLVGLAFSSQANALSYEVNGVEYEVNQTANNKVLISAMQVLRFNTCKDPATFPNFMVHCTESDFLDESNKVVNGKIQRCSDLETVCFDMICLNDGEDWECGSSVLNVYTNFNDLTLQCSSYDFPTDIYKNILSCSLTYELAAYRNFDGKLTLFCVLNSIIVLVIATSIYCSVDDTYPRKKKKEIYDTGLSLLFSLVFVITGHVFVAKEAVIIAAGIRNAKRGTYFFAWFVCFVIIISSFVVVYRLFLILIGRLRGSSQEEEEAKPAIPPSTTVPRQDEEKKSETPVRFHIEERDMEKASKKLVWGPIPPAVGNIAEVPLTIMNKRSSMYQYPPPPSKSYQSDVSESQSLPCPPSRQNSNSHLSESPSLPYPPSRQDEEISNNVV